MTLRNLIIVAVAVLFTGCASTPNTFTRQDPTADFGEYKSYGFYDDLSTDKKNYESMESSFLKVAVAQQMDLRGLSYSNAPDLMVNFYIHTKEKIQTRSVPTMGAYYGFRDPFYDTWGGYGGYETRVDQYTEGTLNIDVVDANSKKLVWEGAVAGRVTDADMRDLEKTIDRAVANIMANYPVQP
jgi:hypothetical protein